MRRASRNLLRELVLTTLVATAGLWLTAAAVFLAINRSRPGLALLAPSDQLLITMSWLEFLIPGAAVIAGFKAYSRSARRGDPLRLLPALLLGAVLTVALVGLQDSLIPSTHDLRRQLIRGAIPLLDRPGEISDHRYTVTWGRVDRDDGMLRLADVVLHERGRDGPTTIARARHAMPRIDEDAHELRLTLIDVVHSEILASARLDVTLDLDRLLRDDDLRPRESTFSELRDSGAEGTGEIVRRLALAFAAAVCAMAGAGAGRIAGLRRPDRPSASPAD